MTTLYEISVMSNQYDFTNSFRVQHPFTKTSDLENCIVHVLEEDVLNVLLL